MEHNRASYKLLLCLYEDIVWMLDIGIVDYMILDGRIHHYFIITV